MKGCLKFFVWGILLIIGASFFRYFILLTPAQRAAEAAAFQSEKKTAAEADVKAAASSKAERERIEALKPEFIAWLQKNAGVQTARFQRGVLGGDVLEVKFDHGWPSKDHARVKAEALARAWRLRSGLDRAECNVYWGHEIIATGVDR